MSQHDLNNFPPNNPTEEPLCFIDLFCGCGGFTIGMERSGFQCLAAVDFNLQTISDAGGRSLRLAGRPGGVIAAFRGWGGKVFRLRLTEGKRIFHDQGNSHH